MNRRIVPVQIQVSVELVNIIDEYVQERRYSGKANFVRQETIQAIEGNSFVHNIDKICAEVFDENGMTNGILQRQVWAVLKEMLAESLEK
jgi:hypothetical protein